jgi:hypothetical protein
MCKEFVSYKEKLFQVHYSANESDPDFLYLYRVICFRI